MDLRKLDYQSIICTKDDLNTKLQAFGAHGWRLVAMTENEGKYTLVFER